MKTETVSSAYFKERQYLENTRSLQVAFGNNDGATQSMAPNASLKLQGTLNRNICQIHCMYAIHGCKCYSKIKTVPIK